MDTYTWAAPANVKAPLDARETEIYQQAVVGLILCNGDETNATEHEGRHEAKFSAEGRRINRTLLLSNAANHTAKITILFTELSRDRLYSEKDYTQRNLRMACKECMHVRFGY